MLLVLPKRKEKVSPGWAIWCLSMWEESFLGWLLVVAGSLLLVLLFLLMSLDGFGRGVSGEKVLFSWLSIVSGASKCPTASTAELT